MHYTFLNSSYATGLGVLHIATQQFKLLSHEQFHGYCVAQHIWMKVELSVDVYIYIYQVFITSEATEVSHCLGYIYIEVGITVACRIGICFILSQKESLACTLHHVTSLSVGYLRWLCM